MPSPRSMLALTLIGAKWVAIAVISRHRHHQIGFDHRVGHSEKWASTTTPLPSMRSMFPPGAGVAGMADAMIKAPKSLVRETRTTARPMHKCHDELRDIADAPVAVGALHLTSGRVKRSAVDHPGVGGEAV